MSFFEDISFTGPAPWDDEPAGPMLPLPPAQVLRAAWSPPDVPIAPAAADAAAQLGDQWAEDAQPAGRPVDPAAMDRAANQLFKAMDGFGTDEEAIFGALAGKSPAEIAAIKAAYQDRTNGRDLDADMQGELGGDESRRAGALLAGDQHTAALEALKDARGTLSTTDPAAVKEALAAVKDPAERKRLLEEAGITGGAESASGIAGTAAKYALIGSVIPGVGTALGGVVGAIVGSLEGKEDAEQNQTILAAVADGKDDVAAGEMLKQEMHGGLFGGGGVLGLGVGRDQGKIESILEGAADPAALARAYESATGKPIEKDLQRLGGDDQDVAVALLHGEHAQAAAARIHRAKDGLGTSEGAIDKELEGASEGERRALEAAYDAKYARKEGLDFGAMLKDELGGDDLEKTRQLADHGELDPAFALKSAMDGAGTDAELVKKTLKGKSKAEIEAIEADYDTRFAPRTLQEDMGGELEISGREGFEIAEALKGDPDSIQDPAARRQAKLARANAAYDFERGGGAGFLDQGVKALSESLGDGSTRSVTDLFSDSGQLMDAHHDELAAIGAKLQRGEPLSDEQAQRMARVAGFQGDDVENFRAAKDQVTSTAAAAGTAVVAATAAVVVEVASAGTATPAVVAAISTLVGGAGGMGIKAGMQGAGYGNDQIATDAVMTIAQAVTAGTVQSEPFLKLLEAMPHGAAVLGNPVLLDALKNGVQGSANAAAGSLLDPSTFREEGGAWRMAKNMTLAGLGGAASGAATAGMNGATQGQARLLSGFLGGVAGGAAQSGVEMAAEGRFDGARLLTNVSTNAIASMIGSASQRRTAEELPIVPESPAPAAGAAGARGPHGTLIMEPVGPKGPGGTLKMDVGPVVLEPYYAGLMLKMAAMRAAQAQYDNMFQAAATTHEGRQAIARIQDGGVVVTMEPGKGSFRQGGRPPRINIDPMGGNAQDLAAILAHEAHHQATFDQDVVTKYEAPRDEFVRASLRNEAEAQSAALEHLRQSGGQSRGQFGQGEYFAEYSRIRSLMSPGADPAFSHAVAREAATRALEQIFGKALPSTSIKTDPGTGQKVLDGPENYRELYGSYWNKANPGFLRWLLGRR